MGDKISARRLMAAAGVPVVPGDLEPLTGLDGAKTRAAAVGYPVAVKASGAGGGKGFRVAMGEEELAGAIEGASAEGLRFFGNGTVYLERYLEDPRHIEVQVLADAQGNTIHLFERDCSIQRRHQKLVEEAPAPAIGPGLRSRVGEIAVRAARAVGYTSAGTVEGLLAGDDFYFLEMNTRIQVEHGVSEMVTGVDIVEQQLRVAAGEALTLRQTDVVLSGHAIECRINAEDASRNFRPSPGTISDYIEPVGEHVRVDSGVGPGSAVLPFYDPMIAKLMVWGPDRESATERMSAALADFRIDGVRTLLPFHRALLASPEWAAGSTCRTLTDDHQWLKGTAEHVG
jgi:acetyl/propionyl-CoA carboxylase alpha subunit